MPNYSHLRSIAQEGLSKIESSILRLLDANPQGLRNAEIARLLGLTFDFRGNYKNYLTYSVLGGLLRHGKIEWDTDTKLFTSQGRDTSALEAGQQGLHQIEEAILNLLETHPEGLRNVEIADLLGLRSDFKGGQRNYLTYTILGGLLERGTVSWEHTTKLFTKV